ncbi:MAG TPA: HEAT repeat domain-containing protein [Polyangiaceae bacterium]|nr:HEAT repeat domain-containing protein [Polyangiaceae bacterium]
MPTEVLAEWVEEDLKRSPPVTPLQAVDSADRAATRTRLTVGALWPRAKERVEALVQRLARDPAPGVRIGAAAGLARMLELAPPLERIELVCRWTVSEDVYDRLAVARALALPTPVFVADLVIAQLARDADHEVRAATVGALRTHFHSDPQTFARLAEELAGDAELAVRLAARDAVPI